METLVIQKFPFGRDTRRSELTSQPGTLVAANNCIINEGGELEQRKSFTPFAATAILDSNGARGCFGLETTQVGLVVFGSALPFGAVSTRSQITLASAMPTGITYVQLQHPRIGLRTSGNYNNTYNRLQNILVSRCFKGLPFVCASFGNAQHFMYYDWTAVTGDGTSLPYYRATCVEESQDGFVHATWNDDFDLASEFSREINLFDGWRGVFNVGVNGRGNIYSPPGVSFGLDITHSTATGNFIGQVPLETDVVGTQAISAFAAFKILTVNSGGTSFISMSAPSAADGTGTTTLLNSFSLGPAADAAAAAARIVDRANAYSSDSGYSMRVATADPTVVIVYAPPSFGAFTFNLTVTLTNGTTASSGLGAPVYVFLDHTVVQGTGTNKQYVIRSPSVSCQTTGGSGGLTFAWEDVSNPGGMVTAAPTSPNTTFSKVNMDKNSTLVGTFRCKVTDGGGGSGTGFVYSPVVSVTLIKGTSILGPVVPV